MGERDPALRNVDVGDDAQRAREAVDQLRPEQQKVILMSVVDGLTHQEIASTTGLPLGTVKTHMRRGLLSLRKRMEGTAGPRPARETSS